MNHLDRHGPLLRGAYQGPLSALHNYVSCVNGTLPTAEELLACLALMQEEITRVTEQAELDVAEAEEATKWAYNEGYEHGELNAPTSHEVRDLEVRVNELEASVQELEVESAILRDEEKRLSDRVRVLEDALAEDPALEREAIQTEHYLTSWDHILSDDAS